jgi:hypothetical protein
VVFLVWSSAHSEEEKRSWSLLKSYRGKRRRLVWLRRRWSYCRWWKEDLQWRSRWGATAGIMFVVAGVLWFFSETKLEAGFSSLFFSPFFFSF